MRQNTVTGILAVVLLSLSFTLSGCQDKSADIIKIAAKPMTEQLILTEMLSLLIEQHTGLQVKITKGVGGGTSNIHPALLKGEFDMYPEYTGTGWSFVLKKKGIPDNKTLFAELAKEYADKYQLEWVGMYGFNNTFGLAVRKDIAELHNLKTYSDLAPYADTLNFGAEYDFYERDDGYDALCKAYGLRFGKHVDLDIGLKYQAINNKQIDVMNVFTTDGQLSASDIVLLRDDKDFYQTYFCGTVVRSDTLAKHPDLRKALMLMDNILTENEMSRLNYAVEGQGRGERAVAEEYLRTKGLIR